MLATVPHPVLDRLSLAIGIVLLAAPITFLQITQPSFDDIRAALGIARQSEVTHQAKPRLATTPAASGAPAAAKPVPVAKPAPAVKTALTSSFVNLRAGKSVSTPIIATLEAGTTVQLRSDADTTWQGVTYQGKSGYIYRSYIQY